jgi:hypothetical protein
MWFWETDTIKQSIDLLIRRQSFLLWTKWETFVVSQDFFHSSVLDCKVKIDFVPIQ